MPEINPPWVMGASLHTVYGMGTSQHTVFGMGNPPLGSVFSIAQLANLAAWYAADAITGVTSGTSLSTWTDLSSQGVHASNATVTLQPIYRANAQNGLPAVEYNLTSGYLQASAFSSVLTQPTTIYCVSRLSATATKIMYGGTAANHHLFVAAAGTWQMNAGTVYNSSVASDASWHVFGALFNGASSLLRVDGVASTAGNAGANTLDRLIIGNFGSVNLAWPGHIGELFVVNRQMTTAEMLGAESHLKSKWGTP